MPCEKITKDKKGAAEKKLGKSKKITAKSKKQVKINENLYKKCKNPMQIVKKHRAWNGLGMVSVIGFA